MLTIKSIRAFFISRTISEGVGDLHISEISVFFLQDGTEFKLSNYL